MVVEPDGVALVDAKAGQLSVRVGDDPALAGLVLQ